MLIKTDPQTIQSYFEDSSGLLGGHADSVIIPENENEISEFLKEASSKKIPVTISGGGTGVAGGRVPFGGVVLSLEKLNKIKEIRRYSENETSAIVGAGVLLSELKKTSEEQGLMYPPDPTEQSSFIGGNIATNASGSRCLKFGSTRKYVRRLTIVLSGGEILNIGRGKIFADKNGEIHVPLIEKNLILKLPKYKLPNVKNSAGYYNLPDMDLIDLFIGGEGTLGVITEAEVSLDKMIGNVFAGVAFFASRESSWEFTREAKKLLDPLSLEYMDANALALLKPDYPLIPDNSDAAIFFEQDITDKDENIALEQWGKLIEKHGGSTDNAWIASNTKEEKNFKEFRHRLPEKVNEIVRKNKFPKTGTDIAVPEENFYKMMNFYKKIFETSKIEHLVFGHIGENHIHANLLPSNEADFEKSREIYLKIVEKALSLKGTVSAEHGIGKLKHLFLEKMLGKQGIIQMANQKKSLDPSLILGQNNLFPFDIYNKI